MKTKFFSVVLLAASVSSLFAGDPFISISAKLPKGEAKSIASIHPDDDASHSEIITLFHEAEKAFPESRRNLFGPDAGFVAIELSDGKETIVIRSWHPLFVKNRDLVVTSHGVESLNGRKPEDVLKEDEAWYREARMVFDKIVSYAKNKGRKDHEELENSTGSTEFQDLGSPSSDETSPSRLSLRSSREITLDPSSGGKSPSRLSFTEERELTISAIDGDLPSRFLNLRTMEFIPPPAALKDWPDEELKLWMMQNPETLSLSRGRGKGWELIYFAKPLAGTRFIKIVDKIWQEKSISMKDLNGMLNQSAVTPMAWGFIKSPDTFLFRSHAGVTHLLRVEEFADNPGSVKLIFRTPKWERKTEIVPEEETARDSVETSSTELEKAVAELERARKLADANVISRMELLQAEEKEALLRAKEKGGPTRAIAMAAIKVRFSRERLKMKQAHFDAGIIPQTEIDTAQIELKSAESDLGKALNDIELPEH